MHARMKRLVRRDLRAGLVCAATAGLCGLLLWGISCSRREQKAEETNNAVVSSAEPATAEPAKPVQPSGPLVPCLVGDPAFPVFAMHFTPGMPPPGKDYGAPEDGVILVAFADGRVIWSDNRAKGGPPYYRTRVTPQRIAELRAKAAGSAEPGDQSLKQAWLPPDSHWTSLTLCWSRADSIQMKSWHDSIEEEDPSVVVTGYGSFEPLAGRTVQGILAQGPGDYQRFRQVWSDWKRMFFSLIPPEGEKAEGIQFEMRRYNYSNAGVAQPLDEARGPEPAEGPPSAVGGVGRRNP